MTYGMKGSEFYGKGNQSPAKKSRGLGGYGKKVEQKHKDASFTSAING